MSYSAKETFKNGLSCDYCTTGCDDEDMECSCLKPCGEKDCKASEKEQDEE